MQQTTAMRFIPALLIATFLFTGLSACKKSSNTNTEVDCHLLADQVTIRSLIMQPATIKQEGDLFFIAEDGTIDQKLRPCNLTQDFKVHNLKVVVTGEVKKPSLFSSYCCVYDLLIHKINLKQ